MYDGDKERDASSKVRGFVFQDYVTVMCLLKDDVEYVCAEYLEDIDVFFNDGNFECIQVKYYPKKYPKWEEIYTDLYYQYLRLLMLRSSLTVKPVLLIHKNGGVSIPTVETMETYVGRGDELKDTVIYSNAKDEEAWLRQNVYKASKKDEQKTILFASKASKATINEFIDKLKVSKLDNIETYKDELKKELLKQYSNHDEFGNDNNWKCIFFWTCCFVCPKKIHVLWLRI